MMVRMQRFIMLLLLVLEAYDVILTACSLLLHDLAGLISVISKNEASNLLNETRSAPKAPDLYLVQLQVFHDLHCLNLIRQWVYMDVYPDQAEWIDGRLNHDTRNAMHVGT